MKDSEGQVVLLDGARRCYRNGVMSETPRKSPSSPQNKKLGDRQELYQGARG